MFSYDIIGTVNLQPVVYKESITPETITNSDLSLLVQHVRAQDNISLPVVRLQNNNLPIVVEPIGAPNNSDLPIVVEPMEAQNNNDLSSEAQNYNDLPIEAQNINDFPIEAQNNDLPIEVQNINDLPIEAQNNNDLPIVVEPTEARNNDNLPVPIEPNEAKNENQIFFINYGNECQGLVIMEGEIESHYYNIHTALLNTFFNDSYAILILEGYMIALIKQTEFFYLIDSHARDFNGMPNPSGTAVVMKFANIPELEQYLYCLAVALHTNLFEIVPLRLHKWGAKQKAKRAKDQDYQNKRRSGETKLDRQLRLKNANIYKKRQQSNEIDSDKQIRLQKKSKSMKRKRSEETDDERRIRLEKDRASKKSKRSEETDNERQIRLGKERYKKNQKRAKKVSQSQHEINQQLYLDMFDNTNNGDIEEQCWAKTNINKFHKSVKYIVSQCTVCQEAWHLKSKPRTPYVCSRCCRDKKSSKKFSSENSMIPSKVPHELKKLAQTEEMLIARALPIMRVYIKPGGQLGYSGHCINLPQNVTELATSLPRYPKDWL